MQRFEKCHEMDLRDYLFWHSCGQDDEVGSVTYDFHTGALQVELFHPSAYVKADLRFLDVILFHGVMGAAPHSDETVLSLTVESDTAALGVQPDAERALYLVFQMSSGAEWHILSRTLEIELVE